MKSAIRTAGHPHNFRAAWWILIVTLSLPAAQPATAGLFGPGSSPSVQSDEIAQLEARAAELEGRAARLNRRSRIAGEVLLPNHLNATLKSPGCGLRFLTRKLKG